MDTVPLTELYIRTKIQECFRNWKCTLIPFVQTYLQQSLEKVISHVFLCVQRTEIARVLAKYENYRLHEISMD